MEPAFVTGEILINAPKEKVWKVLTEPAYISQWDNMPESYMGGPLVLNSVLEWEGHAKLTVRSISENEYLTLGLFLPGISLAPSGYDVNYRYTLTEETGGTKLHISIGDFSTLPDTGEYVKASETFLETAKQQIKKLAEAYTFGELA